MRSGIIAASLAIALTSGGAAMAETSALSAEIGANGIAATAGRLARVSEPTPEELFALAGLQFLSGVEGALQLRWQTALAVDNWSELPILRLPIPPNPAARPFTGEDLTAALKDLQADMDSVRGTLGILGEKDFALELALNDLWFDINSNGIRDPGEAVAEISGLIMGPGFDPGPDSGTEGEAETPAAPLVIRFDTADAAWLTAYTHLISAFVTLGQAYDIGPSVDQIGAASAEMAKMQAMGVARGYGDEEFGMWMDRAATILNGLAQQPDATLTRASHAHLLSMVAENRRFWSLVALETDNDREWIPNAKQVSALGIEMPEGTTERWQDVLAEAERILQGEELIPHWRFGEVNGINMKKLFENPPPVDLILMIQGAAFLPYAETGKVATGQAWSDFERLVWGDSLMFAIWFN